MNYIDKTNITMIITTNCYNYCSLEIIESIEDTANSRTAFQALTKDPKYNISDSFDSNIQSERYSLSILRSNFIDSTIIYDTNIVCATGELTVIKKMRFVKVK